MGGWFKEIGEDEAVALLKSAPRRDGKDGEEVEHDGEWWRLARTDKMDDICTSRVPRWGRGRNRVLGAIRACRYGARFYRHWDGSRTLAVIDRMSDG